MVNGVGGVGSYANSVLIDYVCTVSVTGSIC